MFGLFDREIVMYRDVLPILDKFTKDHKKSDHEKSISDMFPKFFGVGEINTNLVLVFEDILDGTKKSTITKYILTPSSYFM